MFDEDVRDVLRPARLLAALPPALLGLGLSLFVVVFVPLRSVVWGGATPLPVPVPGQVVWKPLAMLGLLVLLLAGGALAGLARRCVSWSHTWSTAAVVSLAMGLSMLADDVAYLISPLIDVLILVALVLALAAVAFVAARRSMAEAALVSMGFVSAAGLVAGFLAVASPMLRLDIALAMAPAGLAFALLIAAFLQWRGRARWIALGLTAVLAAVIVWVSVSAVAAVLPPDLAWAFLRLLGVICAVGFAAPLILSRVLSLRRPALQSA